MQDMYPFPLKTGKVENVCQLLLYIINFKYVHGSFLISEEIHSAGK
jgi:hypothetical protein